MVVQAVQNDNSETLEMLSFQPFMHFDLIYIYNDSDSHSRQMMTILFSAIYAKMYKLTLA